MVRLKSGMLTERDINAFWGGGEQGQDGSSGFYTENVQLIFDVYTEFVENKNIDFQIWGKGEISFGDNIKESDFKNIKRRFLEKYSCLTVEI